MYLVRFHSTAQAGILCRLPVFELQSGFGILPPLSTGFQAVSDAGSPHDAAERNHGRHEPGFPGVSCDETHGLRPYLPQWSPPEIQLGDAGPIQ